MAPRSPEPSDDESVDRAVRMGQLIDLYGPLLTDRQREFVMLHYVDDMSFGEIAREYGISRQAVHDAVKHAETSLEDYDSRLRFSPELLKRREAAAKADEPAEPAAPAAEAAPAAAGVAPDQLRPAIEALEALQGRVARAGGVIYNTEAIRRDLADVLARLRRLADPDLS